MSARQVGFIEFMIICMVVIFSLRAKSWGLEGADVAIYNDTSYDNGGAWQEGIDAIKAMLDSYGYDHEDITPDELNSTSDLNAL